MCHKLHYFQPMRLILFIGALILIWGCPGPTPTQQTGNPAGEVQFSYLQDANQLYFGIQLNPDLFESRFDSALVRWYGTDSTRTPDSLTLNDDGLNGDIISNDDQYSLKVDNLASVLSNPITNNDSGQVYFDIDLIQKLGTITLHKTEYLGNLKPVLVRATAPDTALRPSSGLELYLVTCQVRDANGLDDIQWAGFKSYHTQLDSFLNHGNYIFLYDDGGQTILYNPNITSGDSVAGDGIYSFQVPLTNSSLSGTYRWIFEAQDFSGARSDTLVKQVVIQ